MPYFPSPLNAPVLRDDLPRYPGLIQLLRVTTATIAGPPDGPAGGLYVSSTQQLRTDNLRPRDREPCLVVDINNAGLTAGYYIGRLAGSYNDLPVYEVIMYTVGTGGIGGTVSGASALPGLTLAQIQMLSASLTPLQINDLNNLTACQLQVLLQLPITNIKILSDLTPTQIGDIVGKLTYTQLSQVATQISTPQTLVLTSAYPHLYDAVNRFLSPPQTLNILSNLSSQQTSTLVSLTPDQLKIVAQLTVLEIQTLTNLTPAQVSTLVGDLTKTELSSILSTLTTSQIIQLTNDLTSVQIKSLLQFVTATQITTLTQPQLVKLTAINNTYDNILKALTFPQLTSILTNLTVTQIQTLAKYPPPTITGLVTLLTTSVLITLLTVTPQVPNPVSGSQTVFPNIPVVVGKPSSTPISIPGYVPVAVDSNDKVWIYIGGRYVGVSLNTSGTGGGGGGSGVSIGDSVGSSSNYYLLSIDGSGQLSQINPSTSGYVLTSNGAGAAATFQAVTATAGGSSGDVQVKVSPDGGFGGVSPGTSGNVLKSNGSAWTSAAPATLAIGDAIGGVPSSEGILYSNSSNDLGFISPVTDGHVMKVNGGSWIAGSNSPSADNVLYTAGNAADWAASTPPTTLSAALDRIAAAFAANALTLP